MPSGRCSSRRTRVAQSDRAATLDLVALYKALGGGWSRRPNWLAGPPRLGLGRGCHLDLGPIAGRGPGNEDIDERTYLRGISSFSW